MASGRHNCYYYMAGGKHYYYHYKQVEGIFTFVIWQGETYLLLLHGKAIISTTLRFRITNIKWAGIQILSCAPSKVSNQKI